MTRIHPLPLLDRYLNTKNVIQLLRSGRIQTSLNLIGLFIAKENETPEHHLIDMQANWFAQGLQFGVVLWLGFFFFAFRVLEDQFLAFCDIPEH